MPICTLCGTVFDIGIACPLCGRPVDDAEDAAPDVVREPGWGLAAPVQALAAAPTHAEMAGTVSQTVGPLPMSPEPSGWKAGSLVLLVIGLGPLVILFAVIRLSLKLAFSIMGFSGRGGRSWLDEIFLFHGSSVFFRRSEPVPVYHHVVETEMGLIGVRQEGELVDGRIFPGHRVRFRGAFRNGTYVMASGSYNETLDTELNFRVPAWRTTFLILLVFVIVEFAVLSSFGGTVPR